MQIISTCMVSCFGPALILSKEDQLHGLVLCCSSPTSWSICSFSSLDCSTLSSPTTSRLKYWRRHCFRSKYHKCHYEVYVYVIYEKPVQECLAIISDCFTCVCLRNRNRCRAVSHCSLVHRVCVPGTKICSRYTALSDEFCFG